MSDLVNAFDAVVELSKLLADERKAVAALDAPRLMELAEAKAALAERLSALPIPDPEHMMYPAFQSACQAMIAQAAANQVLLDDASAAMTEALGLAPEAGTYDARAKKHERARAHSARDV